MSSTQELTYSDVSGHSSKKDLYLVIHDKVYNASTFVDEHPGGEEVLLDVGGQDATEAFEDVGHSDEAREILDGLLIGKLQRKEGDPAPKASAPQTSTSTSTQSSAAGLGIGLYAIILVGGALAFGAYKYLQAKSEK
ncbi:MAG: hypothetical protein M1830_007455 [Pleopsidium flavum]|nr:MAG: hypothetical protein M1830_007455 [Pleopsidium flavum]